MYLEAFFVFRRKLQFYLYIFNFLSEIISHAPRFGCVVATSNQSHKILATSIFLFIFAIMVHSTHMNQKFFFYILARVSRWCELKILQGWRVITYTNKSVLEGASVWFHKLILYKISSKAHDPFFEKISHWKMLNNLSTYRQ